MTGTSPDIEACPDIESKASKLIQCEFDKSLNLMCKSGNKNHKTYFPGSLQGLNEIISMYQVTGDIIEAKKMGFMSFLCTS